MTIIGWIILFIAWLISVGVLVAVSIVNIKEENKENYLKAKEDNNPTHKGYQEKYYTVGNFLTDLCVGSIGGGWFLLMMAGGFAALDWLCDMLKKFNKFIKPFLNKRIW